MKTCGDIDGKGTACELFGDEECPSSDMGVFPGRAEACAPMLALVEARAEMQLAVNDFHGKAVLFSSRFLSLAGEPP